MNVIRYMAICVSIIKCPLAFLVNFTITSGKKYGQQRTLSVVLQHNFSPQGDLKSNPYPNLKDNTNTNAKPKFTTRWLALRLGGKKIDHASN